MYGRFFQTVPSLQLKIYSTASATASSGFSSHHVFIMTQCALGTGYKNTHSLLTRTSSISKKSDGLYQVQCAAGYIHPT